MTVEISNTSSRRQQVTGEQGVKARTDPEDKLIKAVPAEEPRAGTAFDRQVEAARKIMRRDHNILRELAK